MEGITSAGLGKPEPIKDPNHGPGNRLIAKDLIRAIETDSQPQGSMYDGRAALEMILAVYESHRLNAPVPLPLTQPQTSVALVVTVMGTPRASSSLTGCVRSGTGSLPVAFCGIGILPMVLRMR